MYVGRACIGRAGGVRVKVEFAAHGLADHYECLKLSLINPKEGVLDTTYVHLDELLGKKQMRGRTQEVKPYIWVNDGKAKWYGFDPSPTDYTRMRHQVQDYVDAFREPAQSQSPGMQM